jgi:hypothetical protein
MNYHLHGPPTRLLWREMLWFQSQWFIHSFIHSFISLKSPQLMSSPMKWGKYLVTVHGAPCGRKACVQCCVAWFPKGIIYDTAITTPVSCSLQHDTFHLGLGSTRTLLASVYRSNPPQDIPTTPVTAYYMTQGMDLHVTIRYRRGVQFMGGRYVVSYQGRLNT